MALHHTLSRESFQSEETFEERVQEIRSMSPSEAKSIKREIYTILKLAIPSMATNTLTASMAIVDLLMVGHLGTDELAAASIATTYFTVFYSFMIGVSFAFESIGSQIYGSRDFIKLNKIFRHGFVVCSIFLFFESLALCAAGPVSKYILLLDDNIANMVAEFEFILIPGLWTFSYYQILTKYLQVQNNMRTPLIINLLGNLMNAGLSYTLIYIFDLGITGAPLATTLSRTFMCITIYISIVFLQSGKEYDPNKETLDVQQEEEEEEEEKKKKETISRSKEEKVRLLDGSLGSTSTEENIHLMKRERLFNYHKSYIVESFHWESLKNLSRFTFSGGIMTSIEIISFQVTTFESSYISTTAVAAQQICLTMTAFTFMSFPLGLAIAGAIRIGNLIGANRPQQAKRSSKILIFMGIFVMLIIIAAYMSTRHYIGLAFSSDQDVVDLVAELVLMICIYQLLDGMQATTTAILRGLARLGIVAKIDFLGLWVIGVPLGGILTFVFGWETPGLWLGFVFGLFVADSIFFYMIYRVDWEKEAELAQNAHVHTDIEAEPLTDSADKIEPCVTSATEIS